MGGEWQMLPVNLGTSIDTKRDPKMVEGKLLRAQDVVYTAIDQAAKRNGYKALSTTLQGAGNLVAPTMDMEFDGELLAADNGFLRSYSPSLQSWLNRGNYVSTDIKRRTIDGERPSSGYADVAVLGNYALYAWSVIGDAGNSFNTTGLTSAQSYAAVVDLSTGKMVLGPTLLATSQTGEEVGAPKCVLLGGTTLAVIYTKWTAAPATQLAARLVSFPGGGQIALGSEVILAASGMNNNGIFDVVATSAGGAIAYSSGVIDILTIDTALNITHTATIANGSPQVIHICPDPTTGNLWIYYQTNTNTLAGNIAFAIYSPTLTVVLTAQNINTVASIVPSGSPLPNSATMIAIPVNQHQQKLFAHGFVVSGQNGGSNTYIDATFEFTIPDSGWPQTITPTLFQNGILPWSRPFTVTGNVGTILGNSTPYAVFLYAGGLSSVFTQIYRQPTFFAVALSPAFTPGTNQYAPLRFAAGDVNHFASTTKALSPPNVFALSGTQFLFAYGAAVQQFQATTFLDGQTFANTFSLLIDFNSTRAYQATKAGKMSILNGGCLHAYDGLTCSEFGFHLFPEITGANQSAPVGGGLVPAAVYYYMAIFQWLDAQGNLHQSEPSEVFKLTVGGGMTAATIYITVPYLSQKQLVGVALFRSPNAGGGQGTAWFQVSDIAFPLVQQGSNAYVSIIDGLSDASIQNSLVPYTSPVSPVLTNTTPPPALALCARGNRLWMVNAEQPNEEWYTKKWGPGIGLSPSGFLLNEIDPKLGEITAIAEMDDKLVSFAVGEAPFVQTGDGTDDTGANSTLSDPQVIPSDASCDNLKSVIVTPAGVLYHSPKGIYLLSRALSVEYIGMDVEAYNAQVITSAVRLPNLSQIRFQCASGLTLVYDYILNRWATFSNHSGLGAVIWQSTYCYVTGGNVLQETAGFYLDVSTPFAPLLETSFLNVGDVQGFMRTRLAEVLGDYVNGGSGNHGVQMSAAYDKTPTYSALGTFKFGTASSSGIFQYRDRFQTQKCNSVSIIIQEVTTGDSAEYMDFTGLSLEAMLKKGLRKLPTAQMVG